MRMSELSRRSGVSVATIKYYLRAGLLPSGRQLSATRAEYDAHHLRRLRLIRALTGVRGLSGQAAGEVLGALAEHTGDTHRQLGLALGSVRPDVNPPKGPPEPKCVPGSKCPPGPEDPLETETETETETEPEAEPEPDEVAALIAELGWDVHASAPARATLAETLGSLRGLGVPLDRRTLVPYARLAERTAVLDLDQLDDVEDPLEVAERALLLTVLLEPALMALRRLAQENESARRHAYRRGPGAADGP